MNESRPWKGGNEQLHELQEKFNTYASFILDGEMIAPGMDVWNVGSGHSAR